MANWEKFKRWLVEPIDGHVLGLFRIIFGLFMAYEAFVYYRMGLIRDGLLAPQILFKYDGLGWIQTLPEPAMVAVLALMGISGLLIASGLLFRWACWGFVLSLSFFLFQDKSYFNNHIYMFILVGVLLSFTDADRFLSLRSRVYTAVPRWQQFILGAQVMIVYFYGGLTKLKFDWWFHQEPVRSMVAQFPATHWLAPLFKTDFTIYTLSFGGLLLDILAPLLLWYKPVRRYALAPFFLFHLANSRIFNDIGIFPFVMLTSLILYFETREVPLLRNWVNRTPDNGKKNKKKTVTAEVKPSIPVTTAFTGYMLAGYFIFQLVFPFRGYFLPNPMDWTSIARNFSWRMKVDTRPIEEMAFSVVDPRTGQVSQVDIRSFVNDMQVINLAADARSVAAFARRIREEVAGQGIPNAIVKARIRVRYNGRPAQFFVDPEVDLASVKYSPFKKLDWVVPLVE
jgi:vitamin K-dependent gamma-carboxylase